jgi:hypothetical protein
LVVAPRFPMKRVLDQILGSVAGRKPVWMSEPDDFVSSVAQRASQEFDRAFDRWRELYSSARTQLMEANARSEILHDETEAYPALNPWLPFRTHHGVRAILVLC